MQGEEGSNGLAMAVWGKFGKRSKRSQGLAWSRELLQEEEPQELDRAPLDLLAAVATLVEEVVF